MNTLIHWLENHLLVCPYKSMFGIDCPGCGMQRSFIELLKGNFTNSLYLYPALLPVIFLLIFLLLHLKYKFKNGASVIKYTFMVCALIITVNYVLKFFL